LRANRIQQKATTVGFDWPDIAPVWDKVFEELQEFKCAAENNDRQALEDEYGDLLFSLVNVSRFINIDPEDALRSTTEKFISRFEQVERYFKDKNMSMEAATLDEMDAVWEKIKKSEKEIKTRNIE